MSDATKFLGNILETAKTTDARTAPFVAFVSGTSGTKALVYRPEEDTTDAFEASVLFPFVLSADDVVVVQPIGRNHVVIGKVQSIGSGASELGSVTMANANTPLFKTVSFSNATTGSTTDTINYQEACTVGISLGAGTWTIYAWGGASLAHSGSGSTNVVIEIDGVRDTARTVSMLDGGPMLVQDDHEKSSVAGDRTVTVRTLYKSSTAGTTTCKNPFVLVFARRTS